MENLPFIDDLWNYNQPKETEKLFLELLQKRRDSTNSPDLNKEYFLEVETQLARTQSLQMNFEKAHHILDSVEKKLTPKMTVVRIRCLLERGRTYNSNKKPEPAKKEFEEAFHLSQKHGEDFYAVDAAHMLGIVHPYPEDLQWNEKAKQLAEKSTDTRARKWLGSLYNNIGWTYHSNDNFPEALSNFKKALLFREAEKDLEKTLIAKWCIARCLRSMARVEEALLLQQDLLTAREQNKMEASSYVYEELGELYLEMDKKEESKNYFAQAYKLLSLDIWMQSHEKERLDRLLELSK